MTALKTYMRMAAEERAWAYHLSVDRAEADYRNGIILARQAAREEGLAEGMSQGQERALRNLMDSLSWTAEQAMDALGIPEGERGMYLERLSKEA